MTRSTPFTFNGADFTSFATNDAYWQYSSRAITIGAFDAANNFVGSCGATLSPSSYNFLTCNIADVTTLVFYNDGENTGWLRTTSPTTLVPLPSPARWFCSVPAYWGSSAHPVANSSSRKPAT